MYSHITIGTNDPARALEFYDAIMPLLGHRRFYGPDDVGDLGYGVDRGDEFFVMRPFDGHPASVGNGSHVAFRAATRQVVRDIHALALRMGATDEGAPGLRPQYHGDYYGAYFRDPDGNKLQVVCQLPVEKAGA